MLRPFFAALFSLVITLYSPPVARSEFVALSSIKTVDPALIIQGTRCSYRIVPTNIDMATWHTAFHATSLFIQACRLGPQCTTWNFKGPVFPADLGKFFSVIPAQLSSPNVQSMEFELTQSTLQVCANFRVGPSRRCFPVPNTTDRFVLEQDC